MIFGFFTRRGFLVAVGIVLAAMQCRGATTADLLAQSDAIIVGTPTNLSVRPDGLAFGLRVATWLSPVQPAGGAPLQLLWDGLSAHQREGYRLPTAPKPGIWFLKNLGNGFYRPLRVRFPEVALPDLYLAAAASTGCPAEFRHSMSDSLPDRIALEVLCEASMQDGSTGTEYTPQGGCDATSGLSVSPRMRAAFMYLAAMSGSRQKATGFACLISANDTRGILLLEQHLNELTIQDTARMAGPVGGWRNADPAALGSLGRIAVRPPTSGPLLKSAIEALTAIHTVETIPWLDKLMDRPETDGQIQAMAGILSFVNGYPIRTAENFRNMSFMQPSHTPYSDDDTWKSIGPRRDATDADIRTSVVLWKAWLRTKRLVP